MNVEDDILWVHLQDLRMGPAGDISADWGRYELIAADPRVDGVGGEYILGSWGYYLWVEEH